MRYLILFSCVMALAAVSEGHAAPPVQRLCSESDLAGTYKMTELRETPKGEEDAWFRVYHNQYLIFNSGRTYAFVAAQHAITSQEGLEKAVKQSSYEGMHIFERKYTLDGNGLLNLYIDGRLNYSYRCMVSRKTPTDPVTDLILTGYSKKKAELYKTFHRWP